LLSFTDLERIKPLDILSVHIPDQTGRLVHTNLRVFGSLVHGTDQDGSDMDLLVDALPDDTLFDLGGLQENLESILVKQSV